MTACKFISTCYLALIIILEVRVYQNFQAVCRLEIRVRIWTYLQNSKQCAIYNFKRLGRVVMPLSHSTRNTVEQSKTTTVLRILDIFDRKEFSFADVNFIPK